MLVKLTFIESRRDADLASQAVFPDIVELVLIDGAEFLGFVVRLWAVGQLQRSGASASD
jgi:hypothetical protein